MFLFLRRVFKKLISRKVLFKICDDAAKKMAFMLRYIDNIDQYPYFKKVIIHNLSLRQTSILCILRHADRRAGISTYTNRKLAIKCNTTVFCIENDLKKMRKLGLIYSHWWRKPSKDGIYKAKRHMTNPWGCEAYQRWWVDGTHPRFGKRKKPIPQTALEKLDAYVSMVKSLKEVQYVKSK